MNTENIMNDDELMNVSGGKEISKKNSNLVYKHNKEVKNIHTVMSNQTAATTSNLVFNGSDKSDFDGKIMAGDVFDKL
ncbi:MAG: hypothetical protein K6E91_12790 [Butyrivibrio sp.]|nr:hypothetical protein [Butyrivibrio sp.]